jgi:hypothetical protein
VPPDAVGAIAIELPVPDPATVVEVELTGSWVTGPDAATDPPDRFAARAVADLGD